LGTPGELAYQRLTDSSLCLYITISKGGFLRAWEVAENLA